MAKSRFTITVDRERLVAAQAVLGASSASATLDAALSEVIRRDQLRHDVEAYRRLPPTEDEAALGHTDMDGTVLADDTDWDAEWPAAR